MGEFAIYEMDLHDEIQLWQGFYVVRVPGGWIYRNDTEQVGGHYASATTFVPFNTEFMGAK